MASNWAETEFKTLKLGHKRIDSRALSILDTLGHQPGVSIPQAFKSWGEIKACYRFFDNDLVKTEKIFSPHRHATIERIKEQNIILILSDTTSLNYSSKESMKGTGAMTHSANKGLWAHCSLAVTPERLALGIVHSKIWAREINKKELSDHEIYGLPLEQKELYRWIEGYLEACKVARECTGTKVINIADRECDFAEFFEEVNKQQQTGNHAEVIVRATYDRSVVIGEDKEKKRLFALLKERPSLGEIRFKIPDSKEYKSREVIQKVKSAKVSFRKRYIAKTHSTLVTVNVVLAIEENPPEGCKPISWIMFTTLPANNLEEALVILDYYLCRWEIEIFFKVLKSGCKVEERQLRDISRQEPLICMLLIIAWRVMYTLMMGRNYREYACSIVFEESEWRAAWEIYNRKKHVAETPPTLGEMVQIIASFGGYIIRKGNKPPGVRVMWIGLQRLRDFTMAWEIFRKNG